MFNVLIIRAVTKAMTLMLLSYIEQKLVFIAILFIYEHALEGSI